MPVRVGDSKDDRAASAAALLETNHRIANSLAIISGMIRLQAAKLPASAAVQSSDVRNWLEQMSVRIDAIGRLHRLLMLSDEGDSVNLAVYLRQIADAAMRSLGDVERTHMSLDTGPDCHVSARQAAAIGLFTVEAITNALKYSAPKGTGEELHIISRRKDDTSIVIEIADNGTGLSHDFDPRACGGTGMRLMRGFADQLKAHLEFERRDIGLCVRLELPPVESISDGKSLDEADVVALNASAHATALNDLVADLEARGNRAFVASILFLDAKCLRHAAGPSLPAHYLKAIDGLEIGPAAGSCGTAAYCGHPIYVSDISADPLWANWPDLKRMLFQVGLRACWSVPIMSDGKVLGTFAIYHREPRGPTATERNLIAEGARSAEAILTSKLQIAVTENG